jgi:hypothetical protein
LSERFFTDRLNHDKRKSLTGNDLKCVRPVPSLEMALAMKFAPMISLTRADEDRYQDAHDFIRIVKSNPQIDLEELALLGELVYHGGGAEITELVRRVRAGEKLEL